MYVSAVFCFLTSLVFGPPVVAKQLEAWQLLPQPEQLSELFFTDYRTLPASLAPAGVLPLTFTIHNLEHQPVSYNYTVNATADDGHVYPLSQGTVRLRHDEHQLVKKKLAVPPAAGQLQVKITLNYDAANLPAKKPTAHSQSIHYWVTITGLAKGAKR